MFTHRSAWLNNGRFVEIYFEISCKHSTNANLIKHVLIVLFE